VLYNEIDKFCCAWLSNLMDAGLISPGKIDDRSIRDLTEADVSGFDKIHFFAGIGGWDYALKLAGWPDDRPVWTGSCPCQPFSAAGKQKSFADDRHLWPEFKRLIAFGQPSVVFGEQVASATEWLRLVRSDLEALGYAVGAIPVQAASAGAYHLRDRYWFVADRSGAVRERNTGSVSRSRAQERGKDRPLDGDSSVRPEHGGEGRDVGHGYKEHEHGSGHAGSGRRDELANSGGNGDVAHADEPGLSERGSLGRVQPETLVTPAGETSQCSDLDWVIGADGKARRVEPGIRLLVDGFPARVGFLRGFGNAIDPRPATAFIQAYLDTERGVA
jgi:DNA (cytosine-5)-methyltransferase 1